LLAIQTGDHIGVPFAAGMSFAVITASFTHQALDAGGKVIVFPGDLTGGSTEQLSAGSLRLRQASRSGQLSFADSRSVQLATGRFDPAYLNQVYAAATTQALEAGYTGLWVSIDMSWARPGVAEPQALTRFEAEAFPLFRDRTLTAICHYDTRIFPADAVRSVCSAHPASLRAAVMRFRFQDRTLKLFGETDLTNRLAFETAVGALTDGDLLDLTGMAFLDVSAALAVARAACAEPGLGIRVTPSQYELLAAAGAPPAQLHTEPAPVTYPPPA
jgi:hypothetical protein